MDQKMINILIIASVIVVLNIITFAVGFAVPGLNLAFSVGCAGVITFIGVLVLTHYVSGSLEQGEMRKSITAAFVIVLFLISALLSFPSTNMNIDMGKKVIDNLLFLTEILVAFYFVSSGVRDYLANKNTKK